MSYYKGNLGMTGIIKTRLMGLANMVIEIAREVLYRETLFL